MVSEPAGSDPYIQAQIAARSKPAVVKTRFLGYRSFYPAGIILAVEGDDDRVVYASWAARVGWSCPHEFFICGGKREVRQLRNSLLIDLNGADQDVYYFVDHDFDGSRDFASLDRVFMLDRYAIENYLVGEDALCECVKFAFPGHTRPDVRDTIRTMFVSDLVQFLGVVQRVNRRLFVARRLGIELTAELTDSLGKIAEVRLGEVKDLGVPETDIVPYPGPEDMGRVAELEAEFAALNPRHSYRGKYLFKFMRVWLERLASECREPKVGIFPVGETGAGKVKNDELSLGSFAMRSEIPVGLPEFLFSIPC